MSPFSDPKFSHRQIPEASRIGKMSWYTALIEWSLIEDREMPYQKDKLAAGAIDRWGDFQEGLTAVKRKYPTIQFQAFWSATKRYAELTKADALIHKQVAVAVHGLVDYLSAERKRVPGDVLRDAERLECLLFMEYDPCFGGNEPPGL